ncbi:alpha/beta fold hydrolase [Streptomyces iranensis]|uniref:alpha/beta fold hydrolase n=1 Tax=Streptomyces iranensis TaxID=576784 RepID=UPI0039B7322C
MATFVLVHGSWLGGWVWEPVAAGLRASGHTVHCPSLTAAGPHVGLDTHIDDIVGLTDGQALTEVVLAGHSYGGMVITGTAYRRPARVRRLVYLDAYLPGPGQAAFDIQPGLRDAFAAAAASRPTTEPWLVPPFGFEAMGLDPAGLRWVTSRATPMNRATHEEPLRTPMPGYTDPPTTYVRCGASPFFAATAATAKSRGVRVLSIEGAGHMAPVSHHDRVCAVLHGESR